MALTTVMTNTNVSNTSIRLHEVARSRVMYASSIKVANLKLKIHTHAPGSKKNIISVLDHSGNRVAYSNVDNELEHPMYGTGLFADITDHCQPNFALELNI
jgi:hypothetical protein